ncbi:MAG: hypothetical protein QM714_14210 [Nocardioides sp.]|uniref:hypothetical protein n=1 Tax=Nocardioides sp. TaxID=35761 RepID=UPI0039E5D5C7
MTDLKQRLQVEVDQLPLLVVDLDAITASGGSIVRRRRAAWVAGGTAAVLAVAGLGYGLAALPGHSARTSAVASAGLPTGPSWAVGSTIHLGDTSVDVGRRVQAMVLTERGAAFTDDTDDVFAVVDGTVKRLGAAFVADGDNGDLLLAADSQGTRVAWISTDGDGFSLATYDVAKDSVTTHALDRPGSAPQVRAVDRSGVYLFDGRGVVRIDGDDEQVMAATTNHELLQDVSSGVFLRQESTGETIGMVAASDLAARGHRFRSASTGTLSPDGEHAISDTADQALLMDTATGRQRDLSLPGFGFLAPYGWIDNDTIAAIGIESEDATEVSIATCAVTTAQCQVSVANTGTADPLDLAFPTGDDLYREVD